MILSEDYSQEWNLIKNKKIPQSNIDEYLLNLLLKIIHEIRLGKRNELDVGDIFGIGIQHAVAAKGYQISSTIEDFFCELSCYKSDPTETGNLDPEDTLENIGRRTKELLDVIPKI